MCAECLEEKHAAVIYGLHLGDFHFRYIGKTVNIRKRYREHLYEASKGGGYVVHNWIRKHGDAVQVTIIETFTDEDIDQIDEREIFHIAQARALYTEENLNRTNGGDGCFATPETKAKMSASSRGKRHTPETLLKMSMWQRGISRSFPKQKAAASLAAVKTNHTRWHVNRGIVKTDCTYCMEAK